MQRTIIVCCRPQDLSLDTRGRPQADDDRHIVMIVRRTSDRVAAFAAVPNAVNLTAEGTIIGDGRAWDTVQFLAVASASDAELLAKSVAATSNGDAYVMTVRASMDAITQG
jgi:hypothetical protein